MNTKWVKLPNGEKIKANYINKEIRWMYVDGNTVNFLRNSTVQRIGLDDIIHIIKRINSTPKESRLGMYDGFVVYVTSEGKILDSGLSRWHVDKYKAGYFMVGCKKINQKVGNKITTLLNVQKVKWEKM